MKTVKTLSNFYYFIHCSRRVFDILLIITVSMLIFVFTSLITVETFIIIMIRFMRTETLDHCYYLNKHSSYYFIHSPSHFQETLYSSTAKVHLSKGPTTS